MTRRELNVLLATVLTTLAEVRTGSAPRSIVMLGLSVTLDDFLMVERVLVAGDLVTQEFDVLTITDKGRETAAWVEAQLATARAS